MIFEKLNKISIFAIMVLFSSNLASAVNIVECVDEQGGRSFQKTCPPGSTQIGEKKLKTNKSNTEKTSSNNVNIQATLYLIPDCEACDEIKEFLGTRNIGITEKDVNDNLELQNELTELAGALKVPTTIIGDEIITGYSRSKFLAALEAAGYVE